MAKHKNNPLPFIKKKTKQNPDNYTVKQENMQSN